MAGRLAGMDADRRLRLVPLQRAAADRPEVQRLSEERDLRRSLHVIDEAGRWASGGEAVLRTMERLPGLRPLARLARLPLLSSLVEPAYRLVADHRARFAWLAGSFVGDRLPARPAGPQWICPLPEPRSRRNRSISPMSSSPEGRRASSTMLSSRAM